MRSSIFGVVEIICVALTPRFRTVASFNAAETEFWAAVGSEATELYGSDYRRQFAVLREIVSDREGRH